MPGPAADKDSRELPQSSSESRVLVIVGNRPLHEFSARVGKTGWTGIVEGAASTDPLLAAHHVASLGHDGEYLIDAFIYQLARENPATAIDWLLEHFPQQTTYYEAIASVSYIRSPVEAFAYLDQMDDGAAKNALTKSLHQAKSVNEASRARSGLDRLSALCKLPV